MTWYVYSMTQAQNQLSTGYIVSIYDRVMCLFVVLSVYQKKTNFISESYQVFYLNIIVNHDLQDFYLIMADLRSLNN